MLVPKHNALLKPDVNSVASSCLDNGFRTSGQEEGMRYDTTTDQHYRAMIVTIAFCLLGAAAVWWFM
jgi:hypothetical protein